VKHRDHCFALEIYPNIPIAKATFYSAPQLYRRKRAALDTGYFR